MDLTPITLVVPALIASLGWLVTHRNNHAIARRRERLDLINQRLDKFYGPLYVSAETGRIAYEAFVKRMGNVRAMFEQGEKPTDKQLEEWYLWTRTVFVPNNERIEGLIVTEAYLIREEVMPECLLNFVAHVASWRAVLEKWEKGNFSEKFASVDFPPAVNVYARTSYSDLKSEQAELIGILHFGPKKSKKSQAA